jgi:hypothetical protein
MIADTMMLEMPSALANLCRTKNWGLKTFEKMHFAFLKDVAEGTLNVRVSGTKEVRRAIQLIRFAGVMKKKGLHSGDALIASTALDYAQETHQIINFYTADQSLFYSLRELNTFRVTMNIFFLGTPKDGSEPTLKALKSSANPS